MEITHNVVGWFEIPVADMDRAIRFYETVFGFKMERNQMGPLDMAWFPGFEDKIGSGGSLVHQPEYYKPSVDGTLVYFTAFSGDLANELSKVEPAGGKVIQPKTLISEEIGSMAIFLDTEGNRVAIHSR
ncbi:MAG: VOC family protein [Bacteroidales bacterium]|nr:VOC family protein [Bacteroidales bacterium]